MVYLHTYNQVYCHMLQQRLFFTVLKEERGDYSQVLRIVNLYQR